MGKNRKQGYTVGKDGWQDWAPRGGAQTKSGGWQQRGNGHAAGNSANTIKPRELKDGDPDPGVPTFDTDGSKWCSVTFKNRLYRVNTSGGGWACPNCAMPANRPSRWYCAICGKKWSQAESVSNGAPPAKPSKPSKPTPAPSSDDSTSSSASAEEEEEESASEADAKEPVKCAAEECQIPNLHKLIAAQVIPTISMASDKAEKKTSPSDAAAEAQAALDGANAQLQLAQSCASTSAKLLDALTAEVEAKKTSLTNAKQKAEKAEPPEPTAGTTLLRLEEAQAKAKTLQEEHDVWHKAASAKKLAVVELHRAQAQSFRQLSARLALEAEKREEAARINQEQWDNINLAVHNRWEAKKEAQRLLVQQLSAAAPALTPTTPPAVAVTPIAMPAPAMKPLVELPDVVLPDSKEEITVMAVVLTGLQQLDEQDLEARLAFPVYWNMFEEQGMDKALLTKLLPQEVLLEAEPLKPVPQRVIGALRRQLGHMSALWAVRANELLIAQDVQAGANLMYAGVMDEAKRVQRRKRLPDAEPEGAPSAK